MSPPALCLTRHLILPWQKKGWIGIGTCRQQDNGRGRKGSFTRHGQKLSRGGNPVDVDVFKDRGLWSVGLQLLCLQGRSPGSLGLRWGWLEGQSETGGPWWGEESTSSPPHPQLWLQLRGRELVGRGASLPGRVADHPREASACSALLLFSLSAPGRGLGYKIVFQLLPDQSHFIKGTFVRRRFDN